MNFPGWVGLGGLMGVGGWFIAKIKPSKHSLAWLGFELSLAKLPVPVDTFGHWTTRCYYRTSADLRGLLTAHQR